MLASGSADCESAALAVPNAIAAQTAAAAHDAVQTIRCEGARPRRDRV